MLFYKNYLITLIQIIIICIIRIFTCFSSYDNGGYEYAEYDEGKHHIKEGTQLVVQGKYSRNFEDQFHSNQTY